MQQCVPPKYIQIGVNDEQSQESKGTPRTYQAQARFSLVGMHFPSYLAVS
jgi:hypothetical protein